MKKIKIGVYGPTGKMGVSILDQINSFKDLELTSLCEKKTHNAIGKSIKGITVQSNVEKFVEESQVVIDFTIPSATLVLMKVIKEKNIKTAIITGTTGYTNLEEKKFAELSKGLKVLRSFNMNFGVNMLKELVKIASKNLSSSADVEIFETHHNMKRDIPSGTAISLANSVRMGNNIMKKFSYRKKAACLIRKKNEIGFSSIRGGDVVGEHTVSFFMDGERVELSHKATDRKIFSNGALRAAQWISKKKPGVYSILDMLG